MKKLYIGNLPFSATEDQLNEWFAQVGVTPSGVNLIRDRFTGQSRGFAFVEVTNDEDADRAVNSLNGQNFGGRNLVVNEARPQAERGGGGGGGRPGGGGADMAAGGAATGRRWWGRPRRRGGGDAVTAAATVATESLVVDFCNPCGVPFPCHHREFSSPLSSSFAGLSCSDLPLISDLSQ